MAAQVIAVVGAAGGVGTSTAAALVARRRARTGGRTVLVDLAPAGGTLDVLLGVEERPGVRWSDLRRARGVVAPEDLEGRLPLWEGVEALSADRGDGGRPEPDVVRAVVEALAARDGTVLLDVPAAVVRTPGWADVSELVHLVVLVTGQDVLGVAGAVGVRPGLGVADVRLVLRARRAAQVAPAEAAHVLDAPLVAVLPTDRSLPGAVDRGFGPRTTRTSGLERGVRLVEERSRVRAARSRGADRGGSSAAWAAVRG